MSKEAIAPTGVTVDGKSVKFGQIHDAFSRTEEGQLLRGKTRYDRYKPEGVTNQEWQRMLGADVNNLEHMRLTTGLTRIFLKHNESPSPAWKGPVPEAARFTNQEKEDLLLTATVHDWGEAKVGDIMFDAKKDSDEEAEIAAMQGMVADMYGKDDSEQLAGRIRTVLTDVLPNRTSKLGRAFNAVERIGYMRTGLNALDVGNNVDEERRDVTEGMQWLTSNVLGNQTDALVKLADIYPAVDTYLRAQSERITAAFTTIPESIFEKYPLKDRGEQLQKFQKAQETWQASRFAPPVRQAA